MIITHRFIKECFYYDFVSGNLIWRYMGKDLFPNEKSQKTHNTKYAMKTAGFKIKTNYGKNYIRVSVKGHKLYAHRVIWFLVYGKWPDDEIDHIDGNSLNNRLHNLKVVSHIENGRNQKIHKNNKSGQSGVYYHKQSKKWKANIGVNGKQIQLGYFKDFESARKARKSAEKIHWFH